MSRGTCCHRQRRVINLFRLALIYVAWYVIVIDVARNHARKVNCPTRVQEVFARQLLSAQTALSSCQVAAPKPRAAHPRCPGPPRARCAVARARSPHRTAPRATPGPPRLGCARGRGRAGAVSTRPQARPPAPPVPPRVARPSCVAVLRAKLRGLYRTHTREAGHTTARTRTRTRAGTRRRRATSRRAWRR